MNKLIIAAAVASFLTACSSMSGTTSATTAERPSTGTMGAAGASGTGSMNSAGDNIYWPAGQREPAI